MCEKDKCQNCKSCDSTENELTYEAKLAAGWHTCPYAEEINGDYVTLCDCDAASTSECAWDI
jgi:hypothetical protein